MAGTTEWKAALKKAGTWGTPVVCSDADGIRVAEESLGEGIPEPIKDENVGDAMTSGVMQGNITVEGTFAEWLRFDRAQRRLALFLGEDSVTEISTGKSYEHAMRFRASNSGLFATLIIDKALGSSKLWEYPSVKLSQLERTIADGKVKLNWSIIANKVARGNGTGHDLGGLTFAQGGLAIFTQLRVRIKEVTGSEGNLTNANEVHVADTSLTLNRNLSGTFVTGSEAGQVDEPETDGLPEGQLKLTFAKYDATVDGFIHDAQVRQSGGKPKIYKAELEWTGPNISGTSDPYTYREEFAALVVSSAPVNASGPGAKVPVEVTFDIVTPESVPNGSDWNWVVAGETPLRMVLQNADDYDGA